MKERRMHHLLLLVMALCMVAGFTVMASAEDGVQYLKPEVSAGTDEISYWLEDSQDNVEVVTDDQSSLGTKGETTWYLVKNDVTWTERVPVNGTVNLILGDGKTLTAKKGIRVPEEYELHIYSQSGNTGKIVARGCYNASGIGGNGEEGTGKTEGATSGLVEINGGVIDAVGGFHGAGIGGSYQGEAKVTINGGTVTATGGLGGASGIGSSFRTRGTGLKIRIRGGNITAKASTNGAGIGAGPSSDNGTVHISGGVVRATGQDGGAGIGGGRWNSAFKIGGSGGKITITGGLVIASGGEKGASGIGRAAGSGGGDGELNLGDGVNALVSEDNKSWSEYNRETGERKQHMKVWLPAKSISLKTGSKTLKAGDVYTEQPSVAPERAYTALTWESSDPEVAKVDAAGHVTALSAGRATITARADADSEYMLDKTICSSYDVSVDYLQVAMPGNVVYGSAEISDVASSVVTPKSPAGFARKGDTVTITTKPDEGCTAENVSVNYLKMNDVYTGKGIVKFLNSAVAFTSYDIEVNFLKDENSGIIDGSINGSYYHDHGGLTSKEMKAGNWKCRAFTVNGNRLYAEFAASGESGSGSPASVKVTRKSTNDHVFTMPSQSVIVDVIIYNGTDTQGYVALYGNGNTGGEVPSSDVLYAVGQVVQDPGQGTLEKEGCKFGGWNTSASGDGQNIPGDEVEYSKGLRLYAKWLSNYYIVNFDKNEDDGYSGKVSGKMLRQRFSYGNEPKLPLNTYTREGYTFTGWSTAKDGIDGVDYSDGQAVSKMTTEDEITLYAQWEPIAYSITYDRDGGFDYNPDLYSIADSDIELETPTKEGYYFVGWTGTDLSSDPSDNRYVTIKSGSTGDRSYKAHWAPLYKITLTEHGYTGASLDPETQIADGTVSLTLGSSPCVTSAGVPVVKDANNRALGLKRESDSEYSFVMPASDVTVEITYEASHSYETVEGTAVVATCEKAGREASQRCTKCGNLIEGAVIPAKGHKLKDEIRNEKKSTCTEAGSYDLYAVCVDCDYEKHISTIKTPALGHVWNDWEVTKEATDTEDGLETRSCSQCSQTETRMIPKKDHVHAIEQVKKKEAACSEDGNIECYRCTECLRYFSDEAGTKELAEEDVIIPAIHHEGHLVTVDEEPIIAATCTTSGYHYKVHKCELCGEWMTYRLVKDAAAHKWGDWKVTKAATELSAGSMTRVCTVCGEKETKTIAKLKASLGAVKISGLKAGKKTAVVSWKKLSKKKLKKVKKIQIQYSTDKSFKTGVKTKTVSAKKTSLKISKLNSKKRYYVRIRAYTKKNGTVHVSAWRTKSVKVK